MSKFIWVPNPGAGEHASSERLHHEVPLHSAWESAGDMATRAEKMFGPGELYVRIEGRRPAMAPLGMVKEGPGLTIDGPSSSIFGRNQTE